MTEEIRKSAYTIDLTGQLEDLILDLDRYSKKERRVKKDKNGQKTTSVKNNRQLEKDLAYLKHGEVIGDLESSYSF